MSYEQAYEKKKKAPLLKRSAIGAAAKLAAIGAGAFFVSSATALNALMPFPFAAMAVLCFSSRSLDKVAFLAVFGAYWAGGFPLAIRALVALAFFTVGHSIYKKPLSSSLIAALAFASCALTGILASYIANKPIIDYIYALIEGALALMLAAVFNSGFQSISIVLAQPKAMRQLWPCAVMLALVFCGVSTIAPLRFHAFMGLSAFLTLSASVYLGPGEASAAAAILSASAIACLGEGLSFAGVIALSAIAASSARGLKKYAQALSYSAAFAVADYISGSLAVNFEIFSTLAGAAAFLAASIAFDRAVKQGQPQKPKASLASEAANRILQAEIETQKSMIREVSRNMTETQQPPKKSASREICKMLAADVCIYCQNYSYCWHEDGDTTYQAVADVTESYQRNMSVTFDEAGVALRERCIYSPLMFKTICALVDSFRSKLQSASANTRFKKLLREQFSHLSQELDKIYTQISRGLKVDETDSEYCLSMVQGAGVPASSLIVMDDFSNRRKVFVTALSPLPPEDVKNSLAQKLSDCLRKGISFDYEMSEKGEVSYVYSEDYHFKLVTGAKTGTKGEFEASGDTMSDVILSNGMHLIALSDGMGSGEGARRQSSRVLNMYEELINSGFEESAATQVVNSLLVLNGDDEIFVSLDMFLFDLEKGLGEYIKAGGAPSYIMSEGKIEKVEMDTLPLGILDETHVGKCSRQFKKGDCLYFMSDGFFDSFKNDDSLIKEHILKYDYRNPQKIADCLFDDALGYTGGEAIDDITIVIARIR